MSTRARQFQAEVLRREQLSERLVRLVLGGDGLAGFASTGVPDEWVALTVPGQFQSRYYTVRSWQRGELVLDVVIHDHGLVTEWVADDVTGQVVTVSEAKGSFDLPGDARWLLLVGDLTALPAIARIVETVRGVSVAAWAEVPDGRPMPDYVDGPVTWVAPPPGQESGTAAIVRGLDWPEGEGYFWMAGESAQMRAIRKHLMREVKLPSRRYDVMGYWRGAGSTGRATGRSPGGAAVSVDPDPIWRAGKAAGKSDEEIWADYDDAQAAASGQADG